MCDRINDGNITPRELSLIEKKKNHFLKMIDAAIENKGAAKCLEEVLEIRLREHKIFCEEKECLVLLCDRVTINNV